MEQRTGTPARRTSDRQFQVKCDSARLVADLIAGFSGVSYLNGVCVCVFSWLPLTPGPGGETRGGGRLW